MQFDFSLPFPRLTIKYRLYLAVLHHLWQTGKQEEALARLDFLSIMVDMVSTCEQTTDNSLRVNCWLELGRWKLMRMSTPGAQIPPVLQADVLSSFKRASSLENCGYEAWHSWALFNFRIASQNAANRMDDPTKRRHLRNHVEAAVRGFANAINHGTKQWRASVQQDLLNLISCLFNYSNLPDMTNILTEAIGTISLNAWLGVVPQLLARIHIMEPSIRAVLHPLLTRLGEKHTQALMYPLSVLLNSPLAARKQAAESLMETLRSHSRALVDEAMMVSTELIRVAILWIETLAELVDLASQYFTSENAKAMLELMIPFHEEIERGAMTKTESAFLDLFGSDLQVAHDHLKEIRHIMERTPGKGMNEEAIIQANGAFGRCTTIGTFRLTLTRCHV